MNKVHKVFQKRLFLLYFSTVTFVVCCAGRESAVSYRPIIGNWRTERGIIMSIHLSPNNRVVASIASAPGFISGDMSPGKDVITNIRPLVDGGYRGVFEMPGTLKPVDVMMKLINRNTLGIITWDRRVENKIMKWQRVEKRTE